MAQHKYVASKTLKEFHADDSFVRLLLGPIGSGKSVGCCVELWLRAQMQQPNELKTRKTRWLVVRDTYRELNDTTLRTFFQWFPEYLGTFNKTEMTFKVVTKLQDGTTMDVEFLFRALDKPDDVKKLLSLELTGAWINEAKFTEKAIKDMILSRVGRYPSKAFDGGPTWFGLIMDSNFPDSDHWIYKQFEEEELDGYRLFKQPSGLSDEAENIENLPANYYNNLMQGMDQEWINVYVLAKYGYVQDGKAVWPMYNDALHYANEPLRPAKGHTLYVGVDFGLTPAAVVGQKLPTGRWLILDELVAEDMGASNFAPLLRSLINSKYSDFDVEFYGDPAGDIRAQTDEETPFEVFAANGVDIWPTYTNDIVIRVESVSAQMSKLDSVGKPCFSISSTVKILRKACAGAYKYRRMQVSGSAQYADKPDKNKFSHVSDALQYMMVGAGEGIAVVTNKGEKRKFQQPEVKVA